MSEQNEVQDLTGSSWILWWRIAPAQLHHQVAEYNDLGLFQSMRGISFLCLFASAVLTAALAGRLGFPARSAYWGALPAIVLAIFIVLGHRWAMVGAMIFWTLERAGGTVLHRGIVSAIVQVVVWCIVMHALYFAFRIEQQRRPRIDPATFD